MSARAFTSMIEQLLRSRGTDIDALFTPEEVPDELAERRMAVIALGGEIAHG